VLFSCSSWRAAVLAGLLLICTDVFPQTVENYGAVPTVLGARAGAMGYALNAEGYDVGNMYINPATLAFLQTMNIVLDHRVDLLDSVVHESIASPVYLSAHHTVAVGAVVTHAGILEPHGELKFTQFGLDVGYAYLISREVSAGILVSGRYGTVKDSALWAGWLSFGLMYSPSPAVSYALTFRGLGIGLNYFQSQDGSRTLIATERRIPQSLELGSVMKFPSTRPFVSIAISAERLFQEQKGAGSIGGIGLFRVVGGEVAFRYRGGFELRPVSLAALRIGYIRDHVGRAQVGLGIYLGNIQANFGIQPSKKLDQFYEASLSIALGGSMIPW